MYIIVNTPLTIGSLSSGQVLRVVFCHYYNYDYDHALFSVMI